MYAATIPVPCRFVVTTESSSLNCIVNTSPSAIFGPMYISLPAPAKTDASPPSFSAYNLYSANVTGLNLLPLESLIDTIPSAPKRYSNFF